MTRNIRFGQRARVGDLSNLFLQSCERIAIIRVQRGGVARAGRGGAYRCNDKSLRIGLLIHYSRHAGSQADVCQ